MMASTVSSRAPAVAALLVALLLARLSTGHAATVTTTVTDELGRLLPDAVVMVTPEPGTPAPALEGSRIATATIDQKDETFVPFVVVIRTGGTVTFRNSDQVRHHVYSFAPIRQFEMVQAPGETSAPIRFDQPGSAAIGCNIHDNMTAYIHVTDAPWAAVTDAQGKAVIEDVPVGRFVASVWHPRLRPKAEPPSVPMAVANDNASIALTIPVLPLHRVHASDH
jgi:plastocyanin